MIRGLGDETSSTYSQTLNRQDAAVALVNRSEEFEFLVGHFW